ncbi:MAG: formate dehydrogenase accessory sulfurtransferase FdhD [Polyangiaceae bacterium]
MSVPLSRVETLRSEPGRNLAARTDELTVEEPLEIRIAGEPLAITLRTPGQDHELVAGFLLAEGLIRTRADLGTLVHCGNLGAEGYGNVIDVAAAPGTTLDSEALGHTRRGTLTTAACGLCGRTLINDLVERLTAAPACAPFTRAFIAESVTQLRAHQPTFKRTGGIHAAGIARPGSGFIAVREDVGRHNAVDKVIGRLLLDGLVPAHAGLLVVSGRLSFELVQKAITAGLAGLVGVSAPSSLAVSTAARFGLLLCGFARADGFNVYAGSQRLAADA